MNKQDEFQKELEADPMIILKQMHLTKDEEKIIEERISLLWEDLDGVAQSEIKKHAVVKYVTKHLTQPERTPMIGFEEMSNLGLVWKINHEVLYPLGIALTRDISRECSKGCIVAPDGKFEFSKETIERNQKKFEYFMNNKEAILQSYLGNS